MKSCILVCITLISLAVGTYAEISAGCDIEDKLECGYYGITSEQCEDSGCCWVESETEGDPWCFVKRNVLEQCQVNSTKRVDCGHYGITKEQCETRECCWDESVAGVPWCFNSTPELTESCQVEERTDCGYFGISPEECASNDCCYDDSISSEPFCFFGKSK